jgi:hypothetical protein
MSVKGELSCLNIHCVLRSIFFCLLALASPACSPVIARPNGITPAVQRNQSGFRLTSDKGYARVPFDLYGDNILIRVRVNNSQPIWLIFDSGASINVINQRTIERLGLKTKGSVNLNAGGGSVGGAFVEGATISLTDVEAFNQMIAAAPLDALAAYSGRDIQGLIGNNFIQNFVVEIDYAHRLLIFHDPHAYSLAHEPDAIRLGV